MPSLPRIQAQDPSTSPTFSMSTNQSQQVATGSIRRNLFASHLSRRPTNTASQNPFGPPSPTHDGSSTSNVFSSTPAMQPSRRGLPFNDIYDPNAPPPPPQAPQSAVTMFSRESIIELHPVTGRPLLPSMPTLPARLRLSDEDEEEGRDSDMEDDQHQMHHRSDFLRSPSHHNGLNHFAREYDLDPDMDIDSSELEMISAYHNTSKSGMRINVHQLIDTTSEESRADRERIEYLLLEMVSRQGARARTISVPDPSLSSVSIPDNSNASAIRSNSTQTSTTNGNVNTGWSISSRRRAGAAGNPMPPSSSSATSIDPANTISNTSQHNTTSNRSRRNISPHKSDHQYQHQHQLHQHPNQQSQPHTHPHIIGPDPSLLPVGKAIDPQEKDELVGLIMTSLRRRLALAEEEGWMYGDPESVGIGASGGIGGIEGDVFD